MELEREIIGQFIDAAEDDHAEAERLLRAFPELRHAKWLGDERI